MCNIFYKARSWLNGFGTSGSVCSETLSIYTCIRGDQGEASWIRDGTSFRWTLILNLLHHQLLTLKGPLMKREEIKTLEMFSWHSFCELCEQINSRWNLSWFRVNTGFINCSSLDSDFFNERKMSISCLWITLLCGEINNETTSRPWATSVCRPVSTIQQDIFIVVSRLQAEAQL